MPQPLAPPTSLSVHRAFMAQGLCGLLLTDSTRWSGGFFSARINDYMCKED
jgi:hypothetical protein